MRMKPQRLKKRYNLEGRIQRHESRRDNDSAVSHVRIDPAVFGDSSYDTSSATTSNQLILSSAKKGIKKAIPVSATERRLSKRQRKTLEKIVEQKKKKELRSGVLEDLQKYKLDAEQLDKLVPVVSLTRGADPKRIAYETISGERRKSKAETRIRPIAGCRRKGGELFIEDVPVEKMNIVESSSSSSEDSEDDTKDDKEKQTAKIVNENEDSVEAVKEEPQDHSPIDHIHVENDFPAVEMINDDEAAVENASVAEAQPRKLKFTQVVRDANIQEGRLKLPILSEEHMIMEAISENDVVVICGETGSGKTTQVPQFLYEAGYSEFGMIGVTEPRRVAAVAMSRRVAEEMSLTDTGKVSFVIRYEGTASEATNIKFMTDGVLLKEVEHDFLLTAYSVIVIDEAHERSVFTDILIGLLSRIVRLRAKRGNPLKLIVMSATLRVDDFTANRHLFLNTPPVINIESRQFPVTVHFSRQTPSDYMAEAFRKVCKIHREQPAGGILVFVTGQDEVHWLVSMLRSKFGRKNKNYDESEKCESDAMHSKKKPVNTYQNVRTSGKESEDGKPLLETLKVNLDEYSLKSEIDGADHDDGATEVDTKGSKNLMDVNEQHEEQHEEQPMWVLPLYALLPSEKQQMVFQPAPDSSARLVVVSTNVGETSLTIPNIRYVVDTGKVKTKLYDKVTGVSTFVITWAPKASAIQRAGRAGRVGPGHCYRLYSTAMFTDEMPQFAEPEIARRPVDDLVLQMKAIGIDRVMNFPFPTPPPAEAVNAAETLLTKLGALNLEDSSPTSKNKDKIARITDLGRLMARLPVSPRFSRILCSAPDRKSLTYLIAMLAGLSVQELLLNENESGNMDGKDGSKKSYDSIRRNRSTWSPVGEGRLLGDAGLFLRAIGAAEFSNGSAEFCRACGIRIKALLEARKVRRQLTSIINSLHPSLNVVIDPKMVPPSDSDCLLLRRLLLSGFGDRIAKRIEDVAIKRSGSDEPKTVTSQSGSYVANGLDGALIIHPSSVLYRERPSFVMFQDVTETNIQGKSGTVYMKLVTAIEPRWLSTMCSPYCTFGDVVEDPLPGEAATAPRYCASSGTVKCHRKAAYGTHNWNLGLVEVDYPEGVDRIRWFARLLLEGKVVASLEQYVPVLLGAPLSIVKTWGRLQPRTEMLVRTLYTKGVDNYASLVRAWQEDSKFLLAAFLEWLPSALHAQASSSWPPVVVPAL